MDGIAHGELLRKGEEMDTICQARGSHTIVRDQDRVSMMLPTSPPNPRCEDILDQRGFDTMEAQALFHASVKA